MHLFRYHKLTTMTTCRLHSTTCSALMVLCYMLLYYFIINEEDIWLELEHLNCTAFCYYVLCCLLHFQGIVGIN